MRPRRPYPGIGHAVLMSLGFLALSVAVMVPIVIIAMIASGDPLNSTPTITRSPWLIIPVNGVAAGGIVWWGYTANKVPWRVLLPLTRVPWSALGAVVVASVGMSVALSEVNNLLQTVWPVSNSWQEAMGQVLDLAAHPWGVAITLIVVAPLTEEPMFRGVILRGLLGRHRPAPAIAMSAGLFGLVHLNPWQFLEAFGLGLAYGWWYRRTRSLIPGVVGHAINNGLVFVLGVTGFNLPGYSSAGYTVAVEHQPWWFTLAGVALIGLGVWWFARCAAGGPPPEPVPEPPPGPQPPPLPVHPLHYALAPVSVETVIVPPPNDSSNPTSN